MVSPLMIVQTLAWPPTRIPDPYSQPRGRDALLVRIKLPTRADTITSLLQTLPYPWGSKRESSGDLWPHLSQWSDPWAPKPRRNTTEHEPQAAGELCFSVFLTFLFLLLRQLSKPKNIQKVGQLHSIKFHNLYKSKKNIAKTKEQTKKFALSLTMLISL